MTCATAGDVSTTSPIILGFINGCCLPNISAAKDRYVLAKENGKKGGRPKTIDDGKIIALKKAGMTNKEVAEAMGCSVSTVEKATRKNRKNPYKLTLTKEAVMYKPIDYTAEMRHYYDSLTDAEKWCFVDAFREVRAQGKDMDWMYFAIQQLGKRSLADNWRLLVNCPGFIEDVNRRLRNDKELRFRQLRTELYQSYWSWLKAKQEGLYDLYDYKVYPIPGYSSQEINLAIEKLNKEKSWEIPTLEEK